MSIEQLKGPGFWYLASPYTCDNNTEMELRYIGARMYWVELLKQGVNSVSPIVHCHHDAKLNGPLHDGWIPFNTALMQSACGLLICTMQGWHYSQGVRHEINTFVDLGKPIYLINKLDSDFEVVQYA